VNATLAFDDSSPDSFPWKLSITTESTTLFTAGASGAFISSAAGPVGGASHNGNFNMTGWLPTHRTTTQTIEDCGVDAESVWIAGHIGSESRLNTSYNFSVSGASASHSGGSLFFRTTLTSAVSDHLEGADERRVLLQFSAPTLNDKDYSSYFGGGEQYTFVNLTGSFVPTFTSEQGVGRDAAPPFITNIPTEASDQNSPADQQVQWLTELLNSQYQGAGGNWETTYTAIPSFVAASGVGVLLNTSALASFDFREPPEITSQVFGDTISGWLFWPADAQNSTTSRMLNSLDVYTGIVGRLPHPPEWTQRGAIVGLEGGTDAVLSRLRQLLEWDVPVSAVWMQDWSGKRVDAFGSRLWWNWQLDEEHYANWTSFRGFCSSKNIQLLAYLNPYLASSGRTNLFDEALQRGFLLRNATGDAMVLSSGSDAFTFGTVDLSCPAARQWYVDTIMVHNAIDKGFTGWMADFGEYVPLSGVYACANCSGPQVTADIGMSLHNEFPGLWAQTNDLLRQAIDALADASVVADNETIRAVSSSSNALLTGSDVLYFSRAASPSSLRHGSVFWAGDQLVSWDQFDGLQSALNGYLSAGFSGMTLMSSDIGGYTMQQYDLPTPPFPANATVNFTRYGAQKQSGVFVLAAQQRMLLLSAVSLQCDV